MSAQQEEEVAKGETNSPSSTATSSATSEAEGDLNAKRKGRMSKVRGLLSGKSWREKRKTKKSKSGADGDADDKSKPSGDDQSTLYGVEVDENSKSAAALAAKNKLLNGDEDDEETDLFNENDVAGKKYLLKVVLLLMDAKSRRFELLQLEFDSVKASVSDVLAQIPIAVTEDCLQKQSYVGITCCDGTERSSGDVLAGFCKGGDVMVAIAQDMTAAGCVKLALPILADPKVMAMLRSSGIDSSPWKETKKKFREEAKREKERQASPKKSASKASPESAPAKSSAEKNGAASKSRSIPSPGAAEAKNDSSNKSKAAPVITFHPNNDTPHTIQSGGIHVTEVHRTSGKFFSLVNILKGIAIVALLGGLIKAVDMYLKAPIKVGQVLSPRTVLHKCGVAGLVPGLQSALSAISSDFDCENAYLVVGDEQVTGYNKDGEVSWVVLGTHHNNKKYCDVDDEKMCKRGLHYLDNKHLIMSGTKIMWVETFEPGLTLHPWPFEEKPLTRTWRKKRN